MKAIARALGVSVGSVSLWTRDIKLTAEQTAALAARNSTPIVQSIYGAIQEYAGFDEPAWFG